MKYKTFTLMFLIAFSCKAQIIPVEEEFNYDKNQTPINDGAYFKDINGVFDKFIGSWTKTINGINYEFRVEKITIDDRIKIDQLIIKYIITDSNGIIIDDTVNSVFYNVQLKGRWLDDRGIYVLWYSGEECNHQGQVFIYVLDNDPNKMNFYYKNSFETIPGLVECNNTTQLLPDGVVTLEKL